MEMEVASVGTKALSAAFRGVLGKIVDVIHSEFPTGCHSNGRWNSTTGVRKGIVCRAGVVSCRQCERARYLGRIRDNSLLGESAFYKKADAREQEQPSHTLDLMELRGRL